MADDDFNERFSRLTNRLQHALGLAAQPVQRAQGEAMEADELYEALRAAADAAEGLRPGPGEPWRGERS